MMNKSVEKLNRILYVEDEPDIRTIAELALEALGGYTVKSTHSGIEALRLVSGFEAQLVLLDVMMPEMDGITTLNQLRKIPQTADTPVMFMTAKVQPDEIEQYMNLGAIGVIAKPFDPMHLVAEIEQKWADYHEQKDTQ